MRLLLDTHVFIWAVDSPEVLSASTLRLLQDRENELVLSAASIWEIAIKYAIGKIRLPLAPSAYTRSRAKRLGITPLPIEFDHAAAVAQLPNIHRDPFDRLLVAQCIIEGLTIVSADANIAQYPIKTIPAR